MIKNARSIKSYGSAAACALLVLAGAATVNAQRDPFAKPGYAKPRVVSNGGSAKKPTAGNAASVAPNFGPPNIEARIEYFKRLREQAAANGQALPKVTSVLTLGEMSVTGIFKTPRGYAAMVEATPIKLSYTIYPGEKFFDGQLVAVEENRLVFRKVTKVGEGKFVASVENKPLRVFSMKSQVEGTATAEKGPVQSAKTDAAQPQPQQAQPADQAPQPAEPKQDKKPVKQAKSTKPATNPFLSPLDEMNSMPEKPADNDKANKGKKPAKIAKNSGQK